MNITLKIINNQYLYIYTLLNFNYMDTIVYIHVYIHILELLYTIIIKLKIQTSQIVKRKNNYLVIIFVTLKRLFRESNIEFLFFTIVFKN